jgi:8-oxo-dGTP pyrophosphatase MutT (NUDIX family)
LSIQATLCLIVKDNSILLLKKSKGLFGEGRWSHPGGKILPNEEPKPAAIREVLEETRLAVKSPTEVGLMYFYNKSQRLTPAWTVHTFLARQFDGVPIGGREGQLKWFSVDALPFDEMWEDDQHWYRLALDGTRFNGWFYFSGDFEKLIDHRIEVKSLPSQVES